MTLHCEHPRPGCATITFASTGRQLVYRCDPTSHVVFVTDHTNHVVGAFGGRGHTAGRLNTPLDVTFVRPVFADEPLTCDEQDAVWLAVADYGNRRVQLFELDGAWVATLAVDGDGVAPWTPSGLVWRAPFLEIEGVEGTRTRLYLTASLLANDQARLDHRRATVRSTSEVRH